MPRKAAAVEYLERLVKWAGGRRVLSAKTGIAAQNLSAYLNGAKSVSGKRLRGATAQVFGEPPAFQPILEGYDLRANALPKLSQLESTECGHPWSISVPELIACLKRLRKSVRFWNEQGGRQGYLNYVREFLARAERDLDGR
jgi:hypothetical protein